MVNLQDGMKSRPDSHEPANQLLIEVEKALKTDSALDVDLLKQLMNELQHFSVETADQMARKEDKPEVTNIDPSTLPPAYRGRIQKYFQRLSET